MEKKYDYKIFISFVFPYIVVLLLALTAIVITSNKFISIVKQNLMKANYSILEQARDAADKGVYEAEMLANQLALNNRINSFIYSDKSNTNGHYSYKLYELIEDLIPYTSRSEIIDSFFIYFKNSNYVVTQESAYSWDSFYKYYFDSQNFPEEKVKEFLEGKSNEKYFPQVPIISHSNTNTNYNEIKGTVYIKNIPLNRYNNPLGTIMIFIKGEALETILKNTNIGENGCAYIIDKMGQIVSSSNMDSPLINAVQLNNDTIDGYKEIKINNEKMYVAIASSKHNDWRYVMVIPSKSVLNEASSFNFIIQIIIISTLILGILISVMLASYNSKPLRKVLNKLEPISNQDSENIVKSNAYEYLEDTIVNLVNKNTNFQDLINQQAPLMYVTFFDRLFKGQFNSEKEIIPFSSYVKVNLQGVQYAVIVTKMYEYKSIEDEDAIEELGMSKVIIKQVINQKLNGEGYLYDVDENNIAILLISQHNNHEIFRSKLRQIIQDIYNILHEQYNMSVFSGVGNIYDDIVHISASFQEAMHALESKAIKKEQIFVFFEDIPQQSESYYFPVDMKQRLVNLTKAGELKSLEILLSEINDENFEKRHISVDMFKQLIYELRGTLIQFFIQTEYTSYMDGTLNDIDALKTLEETWIYLNDTFKKHCAYIDTQKKSHNVELKDQIIDYIIQAYKSPNLSRYDVAAKFGLTEGYLSHFFKEQTGENFSTYLENLRIDEACKLLNDTELTIQEISEQVGYNSVYSFRRAFKRVKGVSPSGLRD